MGRRGIGKKKFANWITEGGTLGGGVGWPAIISAPLVTYCDPRMKANKARNMVLPFLFPPMACKIPTNWGHEVQTWKIHFMSMRRKSASQNSCPKMCFEIWTLAPLAPFQAPAFLISRTFYSNNNSWKTSCELDFHQLNTRKTSNPIA